MIFRSCVKVKVIGQGHHVKNVIDFRIFCIFYLGVKVHGHRGQGQRSHEGPKERQVGSHQRQVASFFNIVATKHQINLGFSPLTSELKM